MRLRIPQEEMDQMAHSPDTSASYIAVDAYVSIGDFMEAVDLGEQWQKLIDNPPADSEDLVALRRQILEKIYGIEGVTPEEDPDGYDN